MYRPIKSINELKQKEERKAMRYNNSVPIKKNISSNSSIKSMTLNQFLSQDQYVPQHLFSLCTENKKKYSVVKLFRIDSQLRIFIGASCGVIASLFFIPFFISYFTTKLYTLEPLRNIFQHFPIFIIYIDQIFSYSVKSNKLTTFSLSSNKFNSNFNNTMTSSGHNPNTNTNFEEDNYITDNNFTFSGYSSDPTIANKNTIPSKFPFSPFTSSLDHGQSHPHETSDIFMGSLNPVNSIKYTSKYSPDFTLTPNGDTIGTGQVLPHQNYAFPLNSLAIPRDPPTHSHFESYNRNSKSYLKEDFFSNNDLSRKY